MTVRDVRRCDQGYRFDNEAGARRHAKEAAGSRRSTGTLAVELCTDCGGWHVRRVASARGGRARH